MKYVLISVPLVFALVIGCSLIGLLRWHKDAREALQMAREVNDRRGARRAHDDLFAIRLSIVLIVLFVGACIRLVIEAINELP